VTTQGNTTLTPPGQPSQAADPAALAMARLLRDLSGSGAAAEGRELVCTPFDGHYGIAGWVACLNGSPPRGIIAIVGNPVMSVPSRVTYLDWRRPRRLHGEAQLRVVRRFWKEHLERARAPIAFTEGQTWGAGQ
jgi:hypothetical protein